jgi:Bifunctional DNA primase/polymerase, N-terminal
MNGIERAMFGTLPKDADAGCGRPMNVARAMAAARTLGGQGYTCFPCRQNKRPSTPNGFKAAETDSEAIGALWDQYPGELVGVATGAMSGVSVLDIDAKHNTARKWWAEHRERLLPSRVHRTRSGAFTSSTGTERDLPAASAGLRMASMCVRMAAM